MYKAEIFRNGDPCEVFESENLKTLYKAVMRQAKGSCDCDYYAFFTKGDGTFHFLTICYKSRFTGRGWSEFLSLNRPAEERTNSRELFILRNT